MSNLLTFKYWFNLSPEVFVHWAQIFFVCFLVALFIAEVIFMFYKKRTGQYRILFKKLYNFCLSNLIIGLLLLFFNFQQVYFLSARFWFLFWAILMGIWLFLIIKNFKKIIFSREERKKLQEFKKYLP